MPDRSGAELPPGRRRPRPADRAGRRRCSRPTTLLDELPLRAEPRGRRPPRPRASRRRSSTAPTTGCSSSSGPAASTTPRRRSSTRRASPSRPRELERRPADRDARLLREAAHDDGLEGADQRPAPRRLRRRQRGPAPGARAAARACSTLGLPVGCEFLDPITPQYIADAVSWGAIGARTTESQIHRQLGSGLSMPVGFKNGTDGNVQVAVDAVRAAAAPHAFAGVDAERHARDPAHDAATPTATSSCAAAAASPTTTPRASPRRSTQLARGRAARARDDRRLSHDNSGKDPERQPAVAADVGEQVAGGNGAIVGVMLESFLVAGRQDLRPGGELALRPVDHRRVHGLGDDRRGARRAGRGRARSQRARARAGAALIGCGSRSSASGLIGGSIGLAARARARRDGHRLRPRRRGAASARSSCGAIDAAADGIAEAVDGADVVVRRGARSARSPDAVREALAARRPDCVVTDVGSTKRALVEARSTRRALHRRPPARRRRDGRRGARARATSSRARRWYLTPRRRHAGRALRAPAPAARRRSARGRRRSTPTTHDRLMAAVSHLPHVLANVLVGAGRRGARRATSGCPRSARASATRPAWPAPTRRSGRDIYTANRDALVARDRRPRRSGCGEVRDLLATATPRPCAPGTRRRAPSARRCSRPGSPGGGAMHELRASVPEPARRRRGDRARARPRGHQHHRHGARRPRPTTRPASSRCGSPATTPSARAGADRRASASRRLRGVSASIDHDVASRPPGLATRARLRRAARQVDLPSRGAARRDGVRAGADRATTCDADGHRLDARRGPRARRARRAARRRGSSSAAPGLREAREPERPIDVGNAGTLHAPAARAGSPAQEGRSFTLDGDELDPPPPGRPDRRAAAR